MAKTTRSDAIVAELARCCSVMERATASFTSPDVRSAHDRIVEILNDDQELCEPSLLSNRAISAIKSRLLRANESVHIRSEIEYVETALHQAGDPFEGSWINPGFYELLNAQVGRWHSLKVLPDDDLRPIVVVGGGALPQSQVVLHRQTGRSIVSIERDRESADACRRMIEHLGHTASLTVVQEDGCGFDYHCASMVVVAAMVGDKKAIARRVRESGHNTHLNIRTPVGSHSLWRTPIDTHTLVSLGWKPIDFLAPAASAVAAFTCSASLR